MRLFLLVVFHALVISFLSINHPQAEEDEWDINDYGDYVVATVPGQVIWGDRLRFVFEKKDKCRTMGIWFSILTMKASNDIYELQGKKIPIRINDISTVAAAEILTIQPAFNNNAHFVMFGTPEKNDVDEFTATVMELYNNHNKFSITLLNEDNFDPNKYFNVLNNSWKLDKLPQKIKQVQALCRQKVT